MSDSTLSLSAVDRSAFRVSPVGTCWLVTLLLALALLWGSPNFHLSDGQAIREAPFGGDFLQEWVGGQMVISPARGDLYDLPRFREMQHRESLIGFRWERHRYYPPIYPPGYYLLFAPLSQLAYPAAAVIWLFLSLVCLAATLVLLYSFHPPSRALYPWLPVAASLFSPLLFSLNIGHKSLLLLLIFTGTYLLLTRNKSFAAGVVCGLAAFKPHFLLLMVGMMLWKREWRFLGGLAVSGLFWLGLCLAAGYDLCVQYAMILLGSGDYLQTGGYRLEMAHGWWSAMQLAAGPTNAGLAKGLALGAGVVTIVGVGTAWRGQLLFERQRFAAQFGAMLIGMVLISPHFYQYDLTILLLAGVLSIVIAMDRWPGQTGAQSLWLRWLLITVVAFYVLAGSFESIAATTGLQLSTPLLVAWFLLLIRIAHSLPQPD